MSLFSKLFSFFTIFVVLSINSYSQAAIDTVISNDDDFLSGFETTPSDYSVPAKRYKVISLGYTGMLAFHNFDEFNSLAKKYFDVPEIKAPIYLSGFNAELAIDQTKNLSIGFSYSAGSKKNEVKPESIEDYTRYINYRLSYTGLELGYAIMPFEKLAILPGVNFGLSYLNIEAYQGKSKYDFNTNDFELKNDTNTYNYAMEGRFFYVEPKLAIHYKLAGNFLLKVTGSYSFAFSPNWTLNHDFELKSMPDKVKPEGMNLQIGICIGFFDF